MNMIDTWGMSVQIVVTTITFKWRKSTRRTKIKPPVDYVNLLAVIDERVKKYDDCPEQKEKIMIQRKVVAEKAAEQIKRGLKL